MILEHAVLPVRPGQEPAFEAAFERARGHCRIYDPFPYVDHYQQVCSAGR